MTSAINNNYDLKQIKLHIIVDRKRELKLLDKDLEKDLDDDDELFFIVGGKWESKSEDNDEREVVNELWDVIRVISTEEEKLECRNNGCTDQAVVTWSSNINPDDKWDICEKC